MKNKPTFFISSTIFDFRDLRSAIKFYLEEQGCTVLASEFNDFAQPVDTHSYAACLNQIQAADYFVLLIGARVGGWFDKTKKISITRQEYRAAYELHKLGKLKIIAFVRSEVWTVKDDRKDLSKFLDKLDLDPAVKASITTRPSKAASDAEFLIDFLEEVGRNDETTKAVKGIGAFPTGNWIHSFSNFREVVDTLRAQVFAGRPIEHAIGRQLLRNELIEITSQMLIKHNNGTVYFPFNRIEEHATKYPIAAQRLKFSITIERKDFEELFLVLIHLNGLRLHGQVLDKILASDVLLEYDTSSGTFLELPIYQAMAKMRNEIRSFMQSQEGENFGQKVITLLTQAGKGNPVTMSALSLVAMQGFLDRAVNIVLLAKAAIRHLDGEAFTMPKMQPKSPITDQVEDLDKEHVTPEDAARFVNQN